MLRVGLTGGLGSGKSTAAAMFAAHGAYVFSADEIAREMMQPGRDVFLRIVNHFGLSILREDGSLDRAKLTRIAFGPVSEGGGRVEELNAIVHPATIARQAELIEEVAERDPNGVAIVESALIFETKYGGQAGWRKRFDKIIFVRASERIKIARFAARALKEMKDGNQQRAILEEEARSRLAQQTGYERNADRCDYVLSNDGSLEDLQRQVDAVWLTLQKNAKSA